MNQTACENSCTHSANPFHYAPQPTTPCNATVGLENVKQYFGSRGSCQTGSADYECFRDNSALKYTTDEPGYWYSPQDLGYCPLHTSSPSNCSKNLSHCANNTPTPFLFSLEGCVSR
jgi:hypothetical protein